MPALRSHLIYELRYSREKADDMLQGFIADQVLENKLLSRGDPERGKFRTFVLKALDNYVVSVERKRCAQKRRPDNAGSLENVKFRLCSSTVQSPGEVFNREWAHAVISQAISAARKHCDRIGRSDIWGVFQNRILDPLFSDQNPLSYGELVERYDLRSPSQAYSILASGKRIFRRCLREVVGEYAGGEEEVEREIRDLKNIAARCSGPFPRAIMDDNAEGES